MSSHKVISKVVNFNQENFNVRVECAVLKCIPSVMRHVVVAILVIPTACPFFVNIFEAKALVPGASNRLDD